MYKNTQNLLYIQHLPETLVLGLLLRENVKIMTGLMVAFGFSVNSEGYTSIAVNSFLNASIYIN